MPLTLPGESVRARAVGRRAGATVYEAEAWLRRAPDRAEPPCPHFGTCGGCAVQHMNDAAYTAWKTGLLATALSRAGFPDAPLAPLARTPPGTRRRADLALDRRPDGRVAAGFHTRRDAAVVDLSACAVLHPALSGLIAPLRTLARDLPCLRRAGSAVVNLLDHGPDLLLATDAEPSAAERVRLAAFARAERLPRLSWMALRDGVPETVAQLAPATLMLSGQAVAVPPGGFLQASQAGEAAILAALLAGLPERTRRIADLYAGIGTLSFALAGHGSVAAFEGDAAAHAALTQAAGGTRVSATRRDLARQPLAATELTRFDVVVLDPPRAGAAEQCAVLAASAVRHAAYVSCSPGALSRDAALLKAGGFRLAAASPVDQFLWSPHLEAVCHFTRG